MRVRNCPSCSGIGKIGRAGQCGFCHGKKKVVSEFVSWKIKRDQFCAKQTKIFDAKLRKLMDAWLRESLRLWEDKNPKPRKFPKLNVKKEK